LDFILSTDSDLRLVLYQSMSSGPTGGSCFTPNGGELRKSRTTFLYPVTRRIPNSQYLALPCSSVALALLEAPHSRSAAQFWETVRVEELDAEGQVVLVLSSERDSVCVTHLLVWRLERFWLHVLKLRDISDAIKVESHFKVEDSTDDEGASRGQGAPLFAPNGLMASMTGKMSEDMLEHCGQGTPLFSPGGLISSFPGKMSDDKLFGNKKRGCEEFEDSANPCCSPNLSVRDKKGSKQLVIPNKYYYVTNTETLVGGPDNANLAALLAPIR
jgi:hypothetical protein